MDKHNEYRNFHTWKDTLGCTAVLVAILLATLSGVYTIYSEATSVASFSDTQSETRYI